MTFTAAPATIEQSDFTAGLDNVSEVANMDPNVLNRVKNLLTDRGTTGSLLTRRGFARFVAAFGHSGHFIKNIHRTHRDGKPYLICVLTDETDDPNNVMLYEVDLEAGSSARIDTPGVTWDNPQGEHFGVTVLEVFYGASAGNDLYSWDGTTWNDDCTAGTYKTLKDDINSGINTGTEYGRDYAFTGKEHVNYSGAQYVPVKGIRFDRWSAANTHYEKGERVSHQADYGQTGSDNYYKSYRCIQAHHSDGPDAEPGIGADWRDYWQVVRLDLPVDEDDHTSEDWYFQPEPHGSPIGAWFADRLWVRTDHVKDKSWLMYSAPLGVDKGEDIPDTNFDVKDWAPGNDVRGPGGGWIPFNEGNATGVIEAIHPHQDMMLVFKRKSVWVLNGKSEATFEPRVLANYCGAVGSHAVTELHGLVYFLADDGLYVTDGTTVEPVQGFEKLAKYLEARIDAISNRESGDQNRKPQVWTWEGRIWISMHDEGNETLPNFTAVYDPTYGSWWNLDTPSHAGRPARIDGKPWLFFGAGPGHGGRTDILYRYADPDSIVGGEDVDDDGHTSQAFASIEWYAETAWWPFSVLRSQRRIRRAWALVKATVSQTVSFKQRVDYVDSVVVQRDTTVASSTPTYIEGKWNRDCHAINTTVAGTKAPAGLYGIAVDTQPRRARYHTG